MLPFGGISEGINVGLALLETKHRTVVKDSLVRMAEDKGINLVKIDLGRPLAEQGPFNVILHKIPGNPGWNQEILSFSESHPDVVVIDPPAAIERLSNRITMLEAVENLQIVGYSCHNYGKNNKDGNGDDDPTAKNQDEGYKTDDAEDEDTVVPIVGIPKQCVIAGNSKESAAEIVSKAGGLRFPIIAKPLVAEGATDAHAMSVAFNPENLSKIEPPVVLQEFINHGGVMFKVYVVGDYSHCVFRKSLPDIVLGDQVDSGRELLSFSRISNTASSDPAMETQVKLPPLSFISSLASSLRKRLGLHLFNFDLIRDSGNKNHYYIIDINYFPGYAKMPDYERVLTDFLLSIAKK